MTIFKTWSTLDSGDLSPCQSSYCWPTQISTLCLREEYYTASHEKGTANKLYSSDQSQADHANNKDSSSAKKKKLTVGIRCFCFGFTILLVVPEMNFKISCFQL